MKIPNLVPQTYRSTLIVMLVVSACFFALAWMELHNTRDYVVGFIDLGAGAVWLYFADYTHRQHKAKAQQTDDDDAQV